MVPRDTSSGRLRPSEETRCVDIAVQGSWCREDERGASCRSSLRQRMLRQLLGCFSPIGSVPVAPRRRERRPELEQTIGCMQASHCQTPRRWAKSIASAEATGDCGLFAKRSGRNPAGNPGVHLYRSVSWVMASLPRGNSTVDWQSEIASLNIERSSAPLIDHSQDETLLVGGDPSSDLAVRAERYRTAFSLPWYPSIVAHQVDGKTTRSPQRFAAMNCKVHCSETAIRAVTLPLSPLD